MALMWEQRTVSRMARRLFNGPHRARLNALMNSPSWDASQVLHQVAKLRLAALKLKPGDRVRVILDDTKKSKRGKQIPGVGKFYDHSSKGFLIGHTYVVCLLEVNGQVIPWGIKLYLKKEWCLKEQHPFRKLTDLTVELLRSLPEFPKGVEVVVLFDAYYLCGKVLGAIRPGWCWISRLKTNRNVFVGGGKRKAGRYGKNLLRRHRKKIRIPNGSGKRVSYLVTGKSGFLGAEEGPVYLVASRRVKEKEVVVLATNGLGFSEREVVREYLHRWGIEVFLKEAKQSLGLGEYQTDLPPA